MIDRVHAAAGCITWKLLRRGLHRNNQSQSSKHSRLRPGSRSAQRRPERSGDVQDRLADGARYRVIARECCVSADSLPLFRDTLVRIVPLYVHCLDAA
eukprot:3080739-Pleurochrysis_carterae.AAC.2